MTIIIREQHQTLSLPRRSVLSVIASATGVGSIVRLGDSIGDPKQGTTAIAASDTAASRVKPRLRIFLAGRYTLTLTNGHYRCPKCDEFDLRFDTNAGGHAKVMWG